MANMMSGLFSPGSGGSGAALDLAEYQQQLKDYQAAKEAYEQGQAVSNIDPYIKQVLEHMTPERQAHIKLQRAMMMNPALFQKGSEGFNQSMQQRGTTIADVLKQEKLTEEANKRHQYKVDNPLGTDIGHKLQYAIAYAGGQEKFDALNDKERMKLMDRAARARQLVDRGLYWEDVVTGERYGKNVMETELARKMGGSIEERLTNYKTNRGAINSMVDKMNQHAAALQRLHEGASNWTTGYGAFLRMLPQTEAREWYAELQTVNSQTVLNTMEELKQLSQNGSTGFGAVNEKELMTMMDKWGKIDEGMSDEAIKEIIERRIEIINEINKEWTKALEQEEKWYNNNRFYIPKSAQEPETQPATEQTGTPPPEQKGFRIIGQ